MLSPVNQGVSQENVTTEGTAGQGVSAENMVVRPLFGEDDHAACVRLQRVTWGEDFGEVVPPSMLQIVSKMGGVLAGAFDHDQLVGFVFGITGLRGGRVQHWSHMLAVHPDYRNSGVGQRLKHHQRTQLQADGVEAMVWSFDPLVARNAHLNLNRLGARVSEYARDLYGRSRSTLHRLGTDRFLVEWDLGRDTTPATVDDLESLDPAIPRLGVEASSFEALPTLPDTDRVAILIPTDVSVLQESDMGTARQWRQATRRSLTHYLGDGYDVSEFLPGAETAAYVLKRQ